MEQHLNWKLWCDYQKDDHPAGSVLHGLNVATGGTNRRTLEEEDLERQLQDMELQKGQYVLTLSRAGVQMQPCVGEPGGSGCIKPARAIHRQDRQEKSPASQPGAGRLQG